MKIDTSDIKLQSSNTHTQSTIIKTRNRFNFTELYQEKRLAVQQADQTHVNPGVSRRSAFKNFSHGARQWCQTTTFKNQPAVILSDVFFTDMDRIYDLIQSILQAMTSIPVFESPFNFNPEPKKIFGININPLNRTPFKTYSYRYHEKTEITRYESQTLDFSADGSIKTDDGSRIDFSLDLEMERNYFSKSDSLKLTESGAALIDPLIINFNGSVPELSDVGFTFDLDSDGDNETIASLMPGSGYLSLDRNQDGLINDGSELFGPSTGNGFGELKAFDLDNNNWIDENDIIFENLSLWENDANGDLTITSIKEAGIGAIYLAGIETGFDFKNKNNGLLGSVKNTGVVLNEDGTVDTIQEIDLATLSGIS